MLSFFAIFLAIERYLLYYIILGGNVMKILAIGDLVGDAGLNKLSNEIAKIKEENNIDFIIVNRRKCRRWNGNYKKTF